MPNSRKRKKKPEVTETQVKKTSNIVKRPLGKAVIIILSVGFLLSVIISLIYTLVSVMQA